MKRDFLGAAAMFAIVTLIIVGVTTCARGAAEPEWPKWCTMVCMAEVADGAENSEADKPSDKRCTGVCSSKKEACEMMVTIAPKHRLRTTGCEKWWGDRSELPAWLAPAQFRSLTPPASAPIVPATTCPAGTEMYFSRCRDDCRLGPCLRKRLASRSTERCTR
jgi:hypothetical protein